MVKAIVLGAGLLLVSGCMMSDETLSVPRPDKVRFDAGLALERDHGMGDCRGLGGLYRRAGWPAGDDRETVAEIERRVLERFRYRREAADDWRPFARQVLEGSDVVEGDCEDLATTVVSLAQCAGVPRERLGLMITQTPFSPDPNHMVGFYVDDQGYRHIVGDTGGRMRPVSRSLQRPRYWTSLEDLEFWSMAPPSVARGISPVTARGAGQ